jgi:adenylosuccinate lyase
VAETTAPAPERPIYKDILADRYATPEMVEIWQPENKIITERRYWVASLKAQQSLGLDISDQTIKDYEAVVEVVDLDSIRTLEETSAHDVAARIAEFNRLGGHGDIHQGFTSRDLTENVEALQVFQSLNLLRDKVVAIISMTAALAIQYADRPIVGRSHNVPAQLTTLGKRFANYGTEMVRGYESLQHAIDTFPLRGIKGPVGTQQDMLDLFEGNADKVAEFEKMLAAELDFDPKHILDNVGQIYPRSIDSQVGQAIFDAAAGPANLALNVRLMAGHDLVTEGFGEGQVGSSAMPHKMNPKNAERVGGAQKIILGYKLMLDQLSGNQWNEGDVSDSIVRRVALPGMFFASEAVTETTLAVLKGFNAFPAVMDKEIAKYGQFVSTTKVLVALEKSGIDRETAHALIKKHAVATAKDMRYSDDSESLYTRLASEESITMTAEELEKIANQPLELVGMAPKQAQKFGKTVNDIVKKHPEAAAYRGQAVL